METTFGAYSGTYAELKPGKKFSFTLDESSYSDVIENMESDADKLCGLPAGSALIVDSQINVFMAETNKKRTKLNLELKISATRSDGLATGKVWYTWDGTLDFSPSGCLRKDRKIKKKKTIFGFPLAVVAADINADDYIDAIFAEALRQIKIKYRYGDSKAKVKFKDASKAVVYLHDALSPGSLVRQAGYSVSTKDKRSKTPVPLVMAIATGDLDADGTLDFSVTQNDKNIVRVFLQNTGYPGAFMPVDGHPVVAAPVDVAIGDIDGDGLNDMAVAGEALVLLLNDPLASGNRFSEVVPGLINSSSVAIGDINGDGRNDLVVTNDDSVNVLLQDPVPANPGNYTNMKSYVTGINATDAAIGDLNGDSLPDLAVANRGDSIGSVSVLMQNALAVGEFLPGASYQTGVNTQAVVIDDLNDDYLPDLAAANNAGDGGSVSVLLQDAMNQGVFLEAENYPGMQGPNDIATADTNSDGLTDIIVADKCSRSDMQSYIRLQDIRNPGSFLYPVPMP